MAVLALAVISAVAGTLQFTLSLKSYISERKRRKREQAEFQQQLQAQLHCSYHIPPVITTPTIIYHSISTYNNCSFPEQHAPGANYYLHPPLQLPITSSPPPLHPCIPSSAPTFQHLTWPPSAPSFYSPPAHDEPITPYSYIAPPFQPLAHFPSIYPPLPQQPISSSLALNHQNSAPASLYSCYRGSHTSGFNMQLHRGASMSRIDDDRWRNYLHGRMKVHKPDHRALQQIFGRVVMHSGACLNNKPESCFCHWISLQDLNTQGSTVQASIAVVDWKKGDIDMFVEVDGVYFMNYRISKCEVSTFAQTFQTWQVFSGKVKGQKLESFNAPMEMVDMASTNVRSTNSWRSLGINDESEDMEELLTDGGSFVRMLRGAVFGLVCSLYEAPSHLSVAMERVEGQLDIMRVIRPPLHISKQDECIFSVFSFGDHGWASQDILFG